MRQSLAAVNYNVCNVREKKEAILYMELTMMENNVIHIVKIESIFIYIIINIITLSLKWYIQDCHNC